ncbi:MAG: type VI secretion system-associated protein TagF [Pseudomonadota bacterium]|nr:type VI secretion system-associated protein TagF [Pseudomonadota bacterium]
MASDIGFFGKLPGYGDFIERNLPRPFVEGWDQWLQRALAGSRQMLGEHWLDSYLHAPLWRFALSTGCVDDNAWLGILLPSVDRVGRYYPLTIALPMSGGVNLAAALGDNGAWFQRLQAIGLACLEESPTVEAVVEVLAALREPQLRPWRLHPPQIPALGSCVSLSVAGDVKPESGDVSLLQSLTLNEALLRQHYASFSLWFRSGGGGQPDHLLHSESLPDPLGYGAMLTGQWQEYGWNRID